MHGLMPRVLIFGANGFVGAYLAREFADHGYVVAASDQMASPRNSLQCDSYTECNLLDADEVVKVAAAAKPDVVINLAAVSNVGQSWRMPQMTIEVNVVGSLNVLEAAKVQEPMPKVLLVGSSEEYAPSDVPLTEESPLSAGNPYGISKAGQERFANVYEERFGMQIYRVRSFNHTGVGQSDTFVLPSWCKQAADIEKSGKPGVLRVGNLHVKRDFSDVRDIVRAYRLLVESDYAGEVFNVGSGVAHTLEELLQSIIDDCSQEVLVEVDPRRLRPSDNPTITCDYTKARRLLGWTPRYKIEDTLRAIYESYLR